MAHTLFALRLAALAPLILGACITVQPSADAGEGQGAAKQTEPAQETAEAEAALGPRDTRTEQEQAEEEAARAGAAGSGPGGADEGAGDPADDADGNQAAAAQGEQQAQADAGGGDAGQQTETTHYCGVMRETIRVCNGSRDTDYGQTCVDDETDCLSVLPPDEREDHNEYCYTRTDYTVFAGEAQPGTCAQFHAYWEHELECLLDSHCGTGELCVDNACVCPQGVACECPHCAATPARCEGEVLHQRVGGGPCDEDRQCVYEDVVIDCAEMGLACDEHEGACVEPSEPPAMTGGDPEQPASEGPAPAP